MPRSRGFTLIEVVVALALAGLVTMLAERLYGGLLDGMGRAGEARERLDRWANGRRLLVQLVGSVEVGMVPGSSFDGRPQSLVATTWCPDRRGWLEPRRASIGVQRGTVTVTGVADVGVVIADRVASLGFDYLTTVGAESRWVRAFVSGVSAPLAVRVRIAYRSSADTLILIVGSRG